MAKTQPQIDWKNRITQYGEQPANQFLAHELNARRHPARQRDALRGSLDAVGWVAPVIVSARSGKILDGHARVEEALSKNEHSPVPFVEVDVSENEERTILATFDPITGLATYEREALDALLREVDTGEAALQEMLSELAEREGLYLDGAGGTGEPADAEPQIDKAAELNKKWQVKPGDLWMIGSHRLLCGDSTKAEDVARVMAGENAQIVITSPPYFNQRPEYSTWPNYEAFNVFLGDILDRIKEIAGDVFILCWNTGDNQPDCLPMISHQTVQIHQKGFTYLDTIIWRKSSAVYSIPRSAHIRTHQYFYPALAWEPVIVFRHGDQMPKFDKTDIEYASTHHVNVWDISQVVGSSQQKVGHPAMFPLELASRCLRVYSSSGSVVYEPFAGSGTTLVAAQNLNRKCYAIEISPDYCAVILERMQEAFPSLLLERLNG